MANKFFDNILRGIGYIPKNDQTIINIPQRDTISDAPASSKTGASFIKAMSAKIVLALQKAVKAGNYTYEDLSAKFATIASAIKVESYLRRSRDRYVELIWKNGFSFVGKNKNSADYIRRRFQEIAYVTQKPTAQLLEEISNQLVLYSNCTVIKIRNPKSSSGKPHPYFGKGLPPIAGYFVADINRMRVSLDQTTGVQVGWEYTPEDTNYPVQNYDFRDVIHFVINREPGSYYGSPAAIPVLNDIKALRRMEENVEILVFQHCIPLFHYSVGSETKPCKDGEVEAVRGEVEGMVTQGMIVTPERHSIVAVGAQREALKVGVYLEYFKTRILTGLGHSTVSLGETGGSSRATATVVSKAVLDAAVRFSDRIVTCVNDFMIDDLLQEGGFDNFDEKVKVKLFIPEIDIDDKIRKEFHVLGLWEANLLTEDEARAELGREPYTNSDRMKTYFELITKPRMIIQAVDEPYLATYGAGTGVIGEPTAKTGVVPAAVHTGVAPIPPSKTGSAAATPSGSQTPAARNNKTAPVNQHGTKAVGPTQRTGGDSMEPVQLQDSVDIVGLESIESMYLESFTAQYYAAQEDIYNMIDENSFNSGKIAINMSKSIIVDKGSEYIIKTYTEGVKKAGFNPMIPINADLKILHAHHVKAIATLFDDLSEKIDTSSKTKSDIINIFDSNKYRIGFIVDWYLKKAYWLAVSSSLRAQDYASVDIIKHCDKDDLCSKYPDKLNLLEGLYLKDLPPYHAGCKCELKI